MGTGILMQQVFEHTKNHLPCGRIYGNHDRIRPGTRARMNSTGKKGYGETRITTREQVISALFF
jgi:hypothetical protein